MGAVEALEQMLSLVYRKTYVVGEAQQEHQGPCNEELSFFWLTAGVFFLVLVVVVVRVKYYHLSCCCICDYFCDEEAGTEHGQVMEKNHHYVAFQE